MWSLVLGEHGKIDIETPDLPEDVVVFDGEIVDTITDFSMFGKAEQLHSSVFCTFNVKHGFRDWIGDRGTVAMLKYLTKFNRIVGFNSHSFDSSLAAGSVIREFNLGGPGAKQVRAIFEDEIDFSEAEPDWECVRTLLRAKQVDILRDIKQHLDDLHYPYRGRKTKLDNVAQGMLGIGKQASGFAGGAEAPKAWRKRKALEVILYCRFDVLVTAQIYDMLLKGDPLSVYGWPTADKVNQIGDTPVILRTR